VITRTPVIVGINDSEDEIKAVKGIASRAEKIELLPYHAMGEHKYAAIGRSAERFEAPTKEKMDILKSL
jgi:pyruvate-formate lyase-activating enzyme